MLKKFSILVICVCISFSAIKSDSDFCQTQGIISDDGKDFKLPYRNESERYQVFYEKLRDIETFGYEIREFYDGLKNIGVADYRILEMQYRMYAYYEQNEILVVTESKGCSVSKLNETYGGTPFSLIEVNGVFHIATPLTLLSQQVSLDAAYLGSTNRFVRGIPVRQWLVCLKSFATLESLQITISYSDPDKWSPALQAPGYESIPVHIEVVSIDDFLPDVGQVTDNYNLFDFRPSLDIREETYFVPTGVYCPNRVLTKPIPQLSKSFSMMASEVVKTVNSTSGDYREISYQYYDEKKLYRTDFKSDEFDYSEIADLETGMVYIVKKQLFECEIGRLPGLKPYITFPQDNDPAYQYVGQRMIRGMNTDVWIAPVKMGNLQSALYEWYFLADEWLSITTSGYQENQPILFMKYKEDDSREMLDIIGFNSNDQNLLAFDLSACHNFPNLFARFTVSDSAGTAEAISKSLHAFKQAALLALLKSAQIPFLRISGIDVVFDDKIYVMFTIFDKSSLSPFQELTMQESYKLIEDDFKAKNFSISFRDSKNKQIFIEPDWDSLAQLLDQFSRYYYKEVSKTAGLSEGVTVVIVIASLVVGIVLGVLASIFVQVRKIKRNRSESAVPQMMSFPNPSAEYD